KITHKVASLVVFIILFTGTLGNSSDFKNILDWGGLIISEECFSAGLAAYLVSYSDFIILMKNSNDAIINLLAVSLVIECLQIILYIVYDYTDNTPMLYDVGTDDIFKIVDKED